MHGFVILHLASSMLCVVVAWDTHTLGILVWTMCDTQPLTRAIPLLFVQLHWSLLSLYVCNGVVLCSTVLCCVVLCYVVLSADIWCFARKWSQSNGSGEQGICSTSWFVIVLCAVLCCRIVCCAVLWCRIVCCALLCCVASYDLCPSHVYRMKSTVCLVIKYIIYISHRRYITEVDDPASRYVTRLSLPHHSLTHSLTPSVFYFSTDLSEQNQKFRTLSLSDDPWQSFAIVLNVSVCELSDLWRWCFTKSTPSATGNYQFPQVSQPAEV